MDREKVIKGISHHKLGMCDMSGKICPYWNEDDNCSKKMLEDALAMLEEQEEQIKNRDESLEKAREEIKELITELAIEKQKQISNIKSELQVQTAISNIQYQNAMMQTQLSHR